MGGGVGAGMGLGMGFMLPQMIQNSMMSGAGQQMQGQGNNDGESAIDKLKKLKEILDLGIISKEEFEEKKKKLMSEL